MVTTRGLVSSMKSATARRCRCPVAASTAAAVVATSHSEPVLGRAMTAGALMDRLAAPAVRQRVTPAGLRLREIVFLLARHAVLVGAAVDGGDLREIPVRHRRRRLPV